MAVAAAAGMLGLSVAMPAMAGASVAAPRAAHAQASCSITPLQYGDNYYANDESGHYLSWDGVFKGQMRTTGDASTLTVVGDVTTCGAERYQLEVADSGNCLEFDGSDTAVIADTCTSSRASQWWYYIQSPGTYGYFTSDYNGCEMFADTGSSGSLVNCNFSETGNTSQWKIYSEPSG